MRRRLRRPALPLLLVAGAVCSMLVVGAPEPAVRTAADASQFQAGNIVSDDVFFNGAAMSAADVQSFLDAKGADCRTSTVDGSPCVKDFRQDTVGKAADSYCPGGYAAAGQETAATIVAKVATGCGISPRVLLVTLQKEQGLITSPGGPYLSAGRYRTAMGYGCPDTAACDTQYYGFQNQLYNAARQFRLYAAHPDWYGYRAGRTSNLLFNPDPSCGSSPVYIQNQATAGLYNYTPYQPNAAALAAGYGTGNSCSAYGNRNFWLYFTDWFGSTQYDAVAASMPKGALDVVSSSYGQITVAGWAFDPDDVTAALQVHAYVDGRPVLATTANLSRPDVAAAFPGVGPGHGYQVTFPYSLGVHQVCTYGINVGPGGVNPQLGCRAVDNEDPGAPVGALDVAASPAPNVISLAGWAVDPDDKSASLAVHVYVDDQLVTALLASGSRPDVAAALSTNAAHGFSGQIPVSGGPHTVCTYAINVGLGSTNTQLGCARLSVHDASEYNPVASLDNVSATGGTVSLNGWAYDPDTGGAPIAVHVYVDGALKTQVPTGQPRPDVPLRYPAAGTASGFSWQGVLPGGQHAVCAFAINTGWGNANPLLGCRQVQTIEGAAANPVGYLDSASGGFGTMTVSGWAYDVDAPTAAIGVHLYLDGAFLVAVPAQVDRPDVGGFLGAAAGPDHGYSWTGTVPMGRHTVCAYAINVGAGTGNPQLGCRSVTVADPAAAHDPVGVLDSVTAAGTTVTASGWALDPDLGLQPSAVHVYLDGVLQGGYAAADPRPDIGAAFPDAGSAHGFHWSGTVTSGKHTVCVFAINAGAGTGINPLLGCRTVTAG